MTSVAKENLPVWRGSTFRKKIIKKEQKVYLTKWPLCREPVDQKLKDKMISKDESHLTYGMHLKCSPFQSANQRKTHNILYGKHQTLFLRLIFWITCCNLFPSLERVELWDHQGNVYFPSHVWCHTIRFAWGSVTRNSSKSTAKWKMLM